MDDNVRVRLCTHVPERPVGRADEPPMRGSLKTHYAPKAAGAAMNTTTLSGVGIDVGNPWVPNSSTPTPTHHGFTQGYTI